MGIQTGLAVTTILKRITVPKHDIHTLSLSLSAQPPFGFDTLVKEHLNQATRRTRNANDFMNTTANADVVK